MESLVPIIIQLVSGAIGGNAAGALMKNLSLGTIGNSLVGILGGGIGGQILGMLGIASGAGDADLGGILSSFVGGGVGGGVLLAVVGTVKKMMSK